MYVTPAPVVPQAVSACQAKVALARADLLAAVEAWVQAQGSGSEVHVRWKYGTLIGRNDPLVAQAAAALTLSPAQLDQLFITAAAL